MNEIMSKYQEISSQDVHKLSISCHNVPDELLDKSIAKNYFQQYGKVVRIRLRPKHKTIIAEFANDESAQTAFTESGQFQGKPFVVSWTKHKTTDKRKHRHKKKPEDPNWSDDPEIKNELEAMKGNFGPNKTYNFRPEVMQVDPPRPKKNTEQENDLLKTIMAQATTNEDKFRILDARDKLIRSRTVRQSELARVLRTIGTCPDMCPEKERLMREVQHQVASYEQQNTQRNIMNHRLAVKQYSRSSADQESPLAHELRPVQVLHLTMSYLLHRIMDVCEVNSNLAEWYHFVWDRTRGIRKDVTQQELCCEKSVQLVEQCARFHVHCAARLVAEDVSVFDDKINTENLTKCLQTLKYMYHDLKVKHNISCRNEAEFRAYIVLLNLNDGNFMWEVQQLSPDIQKSPHIHFALSVYSALDKNNYVRFFKLIKSTSYLNACILLRYFNQVRFRALLTITRTYSARFPYPVQDLCHMLGFEDIPSTIAFLEYHGLQLDGEKNQVFLDRVRFRQPDTPFPLDRAINVVESKRHTSVGEVVCGELLPPKYFETHNPHNSFDDKGYLKITEIPKEFQNKYQQFLGLGQTEPEEPDLYLDLVEEPKKPLIEDAEPESIELPTITTPKPSEELSEPDGEIQSFFGSMKNETRSQSPLMSRSHSPLLQQNTFWGKPTTKTFTSNIFGNVLKPIEVRETTPTPEPDEDADTDMNIIDEAEEEKERQHQQLLEKENLLKEKLLKERLLQKQKEQVEHKKLLEQKQQLIKQQQQQQQQREEEKERENLTQFIFEKELIHEIQEIAEIIMQEMEEDLIKTRLAQISENMKMRKVLQYGKLWKNRTKISKNKRKNFFDNPVWVSARTVPQEAEQLFSSSQDLTLHDIKRYKCGHSNAITIQEKQQLQQLDIYEIVWKTLFEQVCASKSMNFDIYWKIGLSIPDPKNTEISRLLEMCLGIKQTDSTLIKRMKCNNGGSLNVCVKKVEQKEYLNGMIFFNLDHEISLQKLLQQRPIPIVVLNKAPLDKATINLNNSAHKHKILHYTDNNIDEILKQAFEFLAQNYENQSIPSNLEAHELRTIVRSCLGDEFWSRIRSSMDLNTRFARFLQTPNNVIDLYNDALKYCSKILSNTNNYKQPSFPEEFKQFLDNDVLLPCSYEYFPDYWKSPSFRTKLKGILKCFNLPAVDAKWPPENPQHLQQILEEYCGQVFPETQTNVVYKILSVGDLSAISWVDILEIIVLEKLDLSQFSDEQHPLYAIVYDVDAMRNYRRVPWWFQLKTIQQGIKKIKYQEIEDEEVDEPEIIIEEDPIDLDQTLSDIYAKQIHDTNKDKFKELHKLLDDLDKSMEIQKEIMRRFEEKANHK